MVSGGFAIKRAVFYYPILATPDKKNSDLIAASAKRNGFYGLVRRRRPALPQP
jgi:hypothetical protein